MDAKGFRSSNMRILGLGAIGEFAARTEDAPQPCREDHCPERPAACCGATGYWGGRSASVRVTVISSPPLT